VGESSNPNEYKMTIQEFCGLPMDEKTNYMWDNGICHGQRLINNSYIVCIFSLGEFFVEARYSCSNNKVDAILPLSDLLQWEGYVDRVLRQVIHLS
jgi:hypothetical protein